MEGQKSVFAGQSDDLIGEVIGEFTLDCFQWPQEGQPLAQIEAVPCTTLEIGDHNLLDLTNLDQTNQEGVDTHNEGEAIMAALSGFGSEVPTTTTTMPNPTVLSPDPSASYKNVMVRIIEQPLSSKLRFR